MALGPLGFLSLIGVPLLVGGALLRALGIGLRTDRLGFGAWAWMVGTLVTGAFLFGWLWTAPDPSRPLVPVAGLVGIALIALAAARRVPVLPPHRTPRAPGWERAFFAIALGLVLSLTLVRILDASLLAVVTTDEARTWTFRAKLLFGAGGFGPAYAEAVHTYQLGSPSYPLLNSLLQLWAFVQAGEITHVVNRIPIQLGSLALVVALAGGLRRVARPALAGALLLLLPAVTEAATATRLGYSDALVALGTLVALDAYLRWRADGRAAWFALGSLAVAFLLWSKHEGSLIACALIAAALVQRFARTRSGSGMRPRLGRAKWWLLVPLCIPVITWSVNARIDVSSSFLENRASDRPGGADLEGNIATVTLERAPERLGPVLRYFGEHVLLPASDSQLVLLAFLVLLILAGDLLWRSRLRAPAIALALGLFGLAFVFLGLPHDLDWHLQTAAARIAFELVPAALLLLGAATTSILALAPDRARERMSPRINVLRVLFIGWILFRGVAATTALVGELSRRLPQLGPALTHTQEQRIVAALERMERVREAPPGSYEAIWRAIEEHVPNEAQVHVLVPPGERMFLLAKLKTLSYPRRFELERPMSGVIPEARKEALRGEVWILDAAGLDALAEHLAPAARGEGWTLWHNPAREDP